MRLKFLFFYIFLGFFVSGQELRTNPIDSISILMGKYSINQLLPEVTQAFLEMQSAAKKEGIALHIVSGYRSYEAQRGIWNRKYKRFISEGLSPQESIQKIIEYSTLPGTSRHHWGTDIDLIDTIKNVKGDVLLASHFHGGAFEELRFWLMSNAKKYGFELVYTNEPNRSGFNYEPWHYSYAPISIPLLKAYKSMDVIHKIKNDSMLLGNTFLDKVFLDAYYKTHILGVSPALNRD